MFIVVDVSVAAAATAVVVVVLILWFIILGVIGAKKIVALQMTKINQN